MKHKKIYSSSQTSSMTPIIIAFIALGIVVGIALTYKAFFESTDIRSRAAYDQADCPNGMHPKYYSWRGPVEIKTKKGTKTVTRTEQRMTCVVNQGVRRATGPAMLGTQP